LVNSAETVPTRISLCTYQVGFGDCFLLSFHYPEALEDAREQRNLLIDFGSTRWPEGHAGRYQEIAADIQQRTGGRLDAIVISHRHKDHISGYGNEEAASVIAALGPRLVLRPWTENPAAAADATEPALLGERSLRYANGIEQAQVFAQQVSQVIDSTARGFRGDLRELAFDQVPNQDAVTRLDQLAAATPEGGGGYLVAGGDAGLDDLLPGVRTTVLGPPTIEQWPQMTGEREDDPEYWLRQQTLMERMLAAAEAPPETQRVIATAEPSEVDPGPIRWIVEKLHDQQTHSLLRIVRTLDDALNNTSLILLFQTGTRTLLFPGDAQIENWSYALTAPQAEPLRADLDAVDLYKVGHHGSRNASPRSLVKRWQGGPRPLTSVMSTMPGVHGKTDATAVPRATLVDALKLLGPCYRSDTLAAELVAQEIAASTGDDNPYVPVTESDG
jgi:hypothetical protein